MSRISTLPTPPLRILTPALCRPGRVRIHSISGFSTSSGKLLLLVLVAAFPLLIPTNAFGNEAPKKVLIFSSEDSSLPAITILNQAIRSTLKNGSPVRVQFYNEGQDSFRIPNEKYEAELIRLLQRKYEDEHVDLIYVLSTPALKFLLKHRGELFSDTPVIFIVVDQSQVAGLILGPNVTGVSGKVELSPTLDVALALQPQTQKIVVVAGNASLDTALVEQAHREFRPYEGRLEFAYLTGLPIEELRKKLATLPDRSIVFYLSFLSDSAARYASAEALSLIARSSSAPIYGASQTYMSGGVIGGRLISFEVLGARAAETGLRILAGESPQNIPPQTVQSVPMFDWRELRRWGIDVSKLPAGSIVLFKEPTFWEQYKWRIVGVVSLIILQALLIVWLLMNRARRRRAEEASMASEKRYRNVVETQTELICRYLPDSTLTFVNDAYCRYFGKTCDELIGTKFVELMPEPARDAALNHVASLIENPRAETYEHEVVLPGGGLGWQQWVDHVVGSTNGHGVELQGIGRDITERRQAEELLRESDERLKQAISVARFGVFEHDHQTGLLHSSPLTREIHAWGEEDTPSLEKLVAQLHPEDRETFIAAVGRAHDPAGDGFFAREYRIVLVGGKVHWVSARAQTFFEGEGDARRPVRTIGAELDITERKEAEEALRVSESRFRTMADSAPVMIWMSGPDQLCTYVNQGWLEFTGRTVEQELGNGWTSGVHKDDYARCLDTYCSALNSKQPFKIEYRLRRADGVFRWIYDSGTARFTSAGEFLGYIGSCIDIADRKVAEEELRQAHEEVSKLKNQLEAENIYLQEEIKLAHNVDEIVGQSNAIKYVLFKIEQVAETDTTVMILGETGTGKELVARALHSQSPRKDRPLVKVDCAALSASLIESELFGHEKGAFTGASARKIGRFELADGATIFLDEIGELPLELQPKLLRVIQEGEFERLGSSRTIKVDVRIIAATNRNMKTEVEKGAFREDLWYRLNVFPITVPPLRQRKEDIPPMVEHFVATLSKKVGKTITSISSAILKKLQDYSWPGNVRELANVIERAVVTAQGPVLHIAEQFEQAKTEELSNGARTLEDIEKEYITQILDQTAWRIEGPHGAARVLGLNPSTLRTRMVKLGIQKSISTFAGSSGAGY